MRLFGLAAAAAIVFCASAAQAADAYKITAFPYDLGYPFGVNRNGQILQRVTELDGFSWSVVDEGGTVALDTAGLHPRTTINGPNAAGWTAGHAGALGQEAAYLWDPSGARLALGLLPGGVQFNMAAGLNDTHVAGVGDANGVAVAWKRAISGGDFQTLQGTIAGGGSQAEGIGGAGHVVGFSFTNDLATVVTTVWSPDGDAVSFSPGDGRTAYSRWINASGTAIGYFFESFDSFWVWSNGSLSEIFPAGGGELFPTGLTDDGQVVGNWFGPESEQGGAFVWSLASGFRTINSLVPDSGWNVVNAFAVSADGRITADAFHPDFGSAVLRLDPLAAPVPEPATWAFMIAGFGLAGAALRRRPAPAAQKS